MDNESLQHEIKKTLFELEVKSTQVFNTHTHSTNSMKISMQLLKLQKYDSIVYVTIISLLLNTG